MALLARVPLPNLPGGTANNLRPWRSTGRQPINTMRDWTIDSRIGTALVARGSVFTANEFDPFGSSVLNEALLPASGETLDTHSENVAAGETHDFSPSL